MVRTPHCQCRGCGFDPWLGTKIPHAAQCSTAKEKYRKLVAQSCLTLCDPVDSSPPGSSVCGILQALLFMGFSRQEYWNE